MGALVIKIDPKSNKILIDLVRKLGGNVHTINNEQYEDFIFGSMMDKEKTNKTVSRDLVMKKLKKL